MAWPGTHARWSISCPRSSKLRAGRSAFRMGSSTGVRLCRSHEARPIQWTRPLASYCAEMTPSPVFMIRRGSLKFIHCDADPPQLFDLSTDPNEIENLAERPEGSVTVRSFAEEVAARWDSEALRRQVVDSQRSRQCAERGDGGGGGRSVGLQPASRCVKRIRAQPHGLDSGGGALSLSTTGCCIQDRMNIRSAVAGVAAAGCSDK